jgi:hypothetical protein
MRPFLLFLPCVSLVALSWTQAQALSVSATSPSRYELGVSENLSSITVTFDAPILPPAAGEVRVAGTMSGLHAGTVLAVGPTLTFTNSSSWMAGELVTVNLRRSIKTASSDSLSGGFMFAFTIRSAPAAADWSTPKIYPASDVPYFIHGGDLNEDGRPDVAAPNEGTDDVSVFLNNEGTGYFPVRDEYSVGNVPSSIFGEDFDNDGDQDLATADIASGTVSVLLNDGDGTFAPKTTYFAGGSQTRQIHGGDFDGDNDVDLCATSHGTDVVYLFTNNGLGTFTGTTYANVKPGPFAIRTGDFNADGRLDIGVACQDADSLSVMQNNGGGTFTTTGAYRIGDGPWCLNGNDMDGDGDFDLVSVGSFANRVFVLYNDGTGAFPTRTFQTTGSFPLGVFAADVDGDDDIDAMSSNYAGGTVGVYLNDGAGNIALQENLDVTLSGSYTWAHDLDADGDLDLSVVDERSDELYVFYNGPAPAVNAPVVAAPGRDARLTVAPNPAFAGGPVMIHAAGMNGAATVDIHSIDGRRIRRLQAEIANGIAWDGRDADGKLVSAGAYVVSCKAGDGSASTTLRVVR